MNRLFYENEDDITGLLRQSVASAFAESAEGLTHASLHELGWVDFAEQSLLTAVAILSREQGRSLSASAALDFAAAVAVRKEVGPLPPASAVATKLDPSADRHERWLTRAKEAPVAEHLILVEPDSVTVVEQATCVVAPVRTIDPTTTAFLVTPHNNGNARICTVGLSRQVWQVVSTAMSWELLGACDRVLDASVRHAQQRHQFGRPIGSFQAVQLLLAEAAVDFAAAQEVLERIDSANDGVSCGINAAADVALGLSVRAAATCMSSAQQVFGAIGYTAEHPLHRYIKRCLVLSELVCPSTLARRLGAATVAAGTTPSGPDNPVAVSEQVSV